MPWSASCIVSMMRVPPVNCMRAMLRTRRMSLRRKNRAGGAMMKPMSDITGSWITITRDNPRSDIRSRPNAVTSRLITWLTAVAPVVSRAMNSDEWRSAKNAMFCRSSLSSMRRWLSAMMRLPIDDNITAAP